MKSWLKWIIDQWDRGFFLFTQRCSLEMVQQAHDLVINKAMIEGMGSKLFLLKEEVKSKWIITFSRWLQKKYFMHPLHIINGRDNSGVSMVIEKWNIEVGT